MTACEVSCHTWLLGSMEGRLSQELGTAVEEEPLAIFVLPHRPGKAAKDRAGWLGPLCCLYLEHKASKTARVGMFASTYPPHQTCLPATPASVSLPGLHAQGGEYSLVRYQPIPEECHPTAGGKTGWVLLVLLSPN